MTYSKWFHNVLATANDESSAREKAEADYRRCLRREKGANIAARVDRMFCLLSPEHIPCKVKDAEGN